MLLLCIGACLPCLLPRCLGRTFGGQGCCPIPWPCPFGHDALVLLSLILLAILALKTLAMGMMKSSADGGLMAKPHDKLLTHLQ